MKNLFALLAAVLLTTSAFSQNTSTLESLKTTVFKVNVDSLHKARADVAATLKSINEGLRQIDELLFTDLNNTIDWFNNSEVGSRTDSLNRVVESINRKITYVDGLRDTLSKQIKFYSALIKRVTTRLDAETRKASTSNNTIVLDWNTYIGLHADFAENLKHVNAKQQQIIDTLNSYFKSFEEAVIVFQGG